MESIKQEFLELLPAMLLAGKKEKIQLTVSRQELEAMIERIVIKILERQGAAAPGIKGISRELLCHALNISRQTLINWYKDPVKKKLLSPHRHKTGNAWYYDLEGIKGVIESHPGYFGAGRDYAYKQLTNDAMRVKEDNQFYRLQNRAMAGHKLTAEEDLFYRGTMPETGHGLPGSNGKVILQGCKMQVEVVQQPGGCYRQAPLFRE